MENIKVIVKSRPSNSSVWITSTKKIKVDPELLSGLQTDGHLSLDQKTSFAFDGCYDQIDNKDIYQKHVSQIVEKGLDGINGTVFMYG